MRPVDIRNEQWADIQRWLEGDRMNVHEALRSGGPATTRELAERMGFDLLSVRPRVTELFQLGLVRLARRDGREGVYEAVSVEEARCRHERLQRGEAEQLLMGV